MGHETGVVFISSGLAKGPGAGGGAVARELPREWHERRCADAQVPEIVRGVAGWKQALRDFMQRDERLNDVAGIFSQKFIQMGVSKNFTLSTLMDLAWKVLVLTWEAILEEKLPLGDELDRGFKDKYHKLQEQLHESRTNYLKELSRHRDEKRKAMYGEDMCKAIVEIDDEVYSFVPEDALDDVHREYFKDTLKENLKLALTRGASAAGEQLLLLTQQLRERDEEIAAMTEARESMDRQLEQLRKQLEDKDKAANRPVKKASDDGSLAELGRVKAELAEMAEEKLQLEKQVARLRAILQSLGYDPDNLSDEDLENPRVSAQATKEIESTKQLLASAKELNRDLRKQVDDLERRISRADLQLERQEASAAKAAGQLQAQVQRLTAQLADAQAENEALRKGTAESAAEVADLKTSLADLRKASMLVRKELAENQGAIGSGAAVEKQLREQIESLEAQIVELRAAASRWQEDAERAEAELRQERDSAAKARAEMDQLQEQLDELRRAAAAAAKRSSGSDSEELEASQSELKHAMARIAELEKLNAEQEEEIRRLKERIKVLSAKVTETKALKDALEASMEELTSKFKQMKEKLAECGVDTAQFDKIVEELGINITPISKPGSVFQRLYYDALKRRSGAVIQKVLAEKERDRTRVVRGRFGAAVAAMSMGNKLSKLEAFDEGAEGVDAPQTSSEEADSPASHRVAPLSPLGLPGSPAAALQVCPRCGMQLTALPTSARSSPMPVLASTDTSKRGSSFGIGVRRGSVVAFMAEAASRSSRQLETAPALGVTGFKAGAVPLAIDAALQSGAAPSVQSPSRRPLGTLRRPSSAALPLTWEAGDAAATGSPAAGLRRRLVQMKVAGVLLGEVRTPPASPSGGGLPMGSEILARDHGPGSPARGSASSSEPAKVLHSRPSSRESKLSSTTLKGQAPSPGGPSSAALALETGPAPGLAPGAGSAGSGHGPLPGVVHKSWAAEPTAASVEHAAGGRGKLSRAGAPPGGDAPALRMPDGITGHAAAAVAAAARRTPPRASATAPALLAASSGGGGGRDDVSLLGVQGRGGGAGASARGAAKAVASAPLQRLQSSGVAGVGPRPVTTPSDSGALTKALSCESVGGQRQQPKVTTGAPPRPCRSPQPAGPEGQRQLATVGPAQAPVARGSTSVFDCLDNTGGSYQVFHKQPVEMTTSLQAEPTGVWIQGRRNDPNQSLADAITSAPIAGARRAHRAPTARILVEHAPHADQDPLLDALQKSAEFEKETRSELRSSPRRSLTAPALSGPKATARAVTGRAPQQPLHGRALPRAADVAGGADLCIGGGAVGTASRGAPPGR